MSEDLDLSRLRVTARMGVTERGGPVRTIITGRKRIPTGRFHSAKNGRSLPWEGEVEPDYLVVCEADTDIVSFLSQPHMLEIDVGSDDPLIYFPDLDLLHADGSREIVEIKSAADRPTDDYSYKLDVAREYYAGLGWNFSKIHENEVRRQPRLKNAKQIYLSRNVHVSPHDMLKVMRFVGERGVVDLASVIAKLGGGPVAKRQAYSLMIRRVIWIDIELLPLDDDSPVRLVTRDPDMWRLR